MSKHKDGGRQVFLMDTPLGAATTTVWDDCQMCGQANDQPSTDMCKECEAYCQMCGQANDQPSTDMCKECEAYCGMGCWAKKIPTEKGA